jgi:protein-S-isoprenylcysteine O-methyltransferase Ste14
MLKLYRIFSVAARETFAQTRISVAVAKAAWNGSGPRPASEKTRDKGDEIRRRRQKGFPDSAFRPFYFYMVFASALSFPVPSTGRIFHSAILSWAGVAACLAGLGLLLWSLISFGKSFRVGIDTRRPDKLVANSIFAHSRNPIYVAFALILIGEFLIFSNWILLTYIGPAVWLFTVRFYAKKNIWRNTMARNTPTIATG